MKRLSRDSLGTYCFVSSENDITSIEADTLARLIYLSSFAEYDTGKLCLTQRTVMHKSDLFRVLGLSRTSTYRFLDNAKDYLYIGDKEELYLNTDLFRRGRLNRKQYRSYQTVFINTVRSLYEKVSPIDHKRLGYIFQLMPYISKEYNVLCFNPDETDINKIQFMRSREFCRIIGHNVSTFSRLRREYSRIKLSVDGRQQAFCTFVYDKARSDDVQIYVNPHVLYSGSDYKKVEMLGMFG